jgi:hypothetical protein
MGLAALYGVGSGALHAVTGPDHVLSLGPAALGRPERSFGIGLSWGLGHALGTLALAIPLLFATHVVAPDALALFGDRLSALALLAMGAWSYRSLARREPSHDVANGRRPFAIGLVHGIGGAGSLMLLVPVLVGGSLEKTLLFLVAFGAGSTLAMAALTTALATLGARLARSVLPRAQRVLSVLSIGVGAVWLVT